MDYGDLLTRAWNTIWNHKFLVGLGILVALGNGQLNARGSNFGGGSSSGGGSNGGFNPGGLSGTQFCSNINEGFRGLGVQGTAIVGVVVAILCVALVIGLIFWAIGRIAEGGLINGVDEAESGRPTGFVSAWTAGWKRVWQLLGIGAIAGIPGILILVILVVLGFMVITGTDWQAVCLAAANNNTEQLRLLLGSLGTVWLIAAVVCCPLWLLSLILSAIRAFADRACMIEGHGVLESYNRGWEVLRANLGQAIILFVIQLVLGIVIGVLLFLPTLLIALCCLLWPILWIISGTLQAYFSTLWTLAWRQWIGPKPVGEPPSPTPAPAV